MKLLSLLIAFFLVLPAWAQIEVLSFESSVLKVRGGVSLREGQRYMISSGSRRLAIGRVEKLAGDGTAEMTLEKGKLSDVRGLSFQLLASKKSALPSWGVGLGLGTLTLPVELSSQKDVRLSGGVQDVRVSRHLYWNPQFVFRFSALLTRWEATGSAPNVCRGQTCVYRAQMLGGGAQLFREMRFRKWNARCGVGFDFLYAMQLETNVFEENGAKFQLPVLALCEADWKSVLVGLQIQIIPSQMNAGPQPSLNLGYLF